MSTTKVYLAGPMSGVPQFNYPAFIEAAKELRTQGFNVVSPAELDSEKMRKMAFGSKTGNVEEMVKNCGETWGDCLARDVKLLADCGIEGIVTLPNWWKSKGARLEVFVGITCGVPIYSYRGPGEPDLLDNRRCMNLIQEYVLQ